MAAYSIEHFWRPRLSLKAQGPERAIKGWSFQESGFNAYLEAPLDKSSDIGDGDASNCPLLLVSAPGAIGKSTLAKQIAAATKAIYIDLALAEPVGGNSLTGGLAKCGLYDAWRRGDTAVLLDGLDEARLRVTQEAFQAFLSDVLEASSGRTVPTVLFGRTGAVLDAYLMLLDMNVDVPVLEIGYFDLNQARQFAEARVRLKKPELTQVEPERRAISLLLDQLQASTIRDGDRFVGYAPVLMAVADRVSRETNLGYLIAQLEAGQQTITFQSIVDAILERERGKLSTLQFTEEGVVDRLYTCDEQLRRLNAIIHGRPTPPFPTLNAEDTQTYSHALDTWVPDHPFLNGNAETSSAVFDGRIAAFGLLDKDFSQAVQSRELARGAAANPFLAEFFLEGLKGEQAIEPECIGLLYGSLRAQLRIGDRAGLTVDEADADNDAEGGAEVEIAIERRNADIVSHIELISHQAGSIRLGAHVQDVEITASAGDVEVGIGSELTFVAPVSISCRNLSIVATRLIVENAPEVPGSTFLEAEELRVSGSPTMPVVRTGASLSVLWPHASAYPWTNFAIQPAPATNPKVVEGLRRFRKFVIAFRSHSKGALRRLQAKLDHARMTKGVGGVVLEALKSEGIITVVDKMYDLNPMLLAEKTGASYSGVMAQNYDAKTVDFVATILENHGHA